MQHIDSPSKLHLGKAIELHIVCFGFILSNYLYYMHEVYKGKELRLQFQTYLPGISPTELNRTCVIELCCVVLSIGLCNISEILCMFTSEEFPLNKIGLSKKYL